MRKLQGIFVECCNDLQARVLVMLCITRSEGRHGCLHAKEETRFQELLRQLFVLGSILKIGEQEVWCWRAHMKEGRHESWQQGLQPLSLNWLWSKPVSPVINLDPGICTSTYWQQVCRTFTLYTSQLSMGAVSLGTQCICQPFCSRIQTISSQSIRCNNLPGPVSDVLQLQGLSKFSCRQSSFQVLFVGHH